MPPIFVRVPGGPDAVAEFRQMLQEVGEEGGHLLAEFVELQNFKTFDDIPNRDVSTTAGLFIRYLREWAVFYMARRRPFAIVIVHVARYRRDGAIDATLFEAAAQEGFKRLRKL